MPTVNIRQARIDDMNIVAKNIREEDKREVISQGYNNQAEALKNSYNSSRFRFTVELKGKPVAMFGLVEVDKNTANIWLLGTPGLERMKKSFVIASRETIVGFLKEYPVLFAQVDARYTKTRRWLEWLGAVDGGPYKLNGIDFNNFVFRRA